MSNSYINILKQNNVNHDIINKSSIFPLYKISKHSGIVIKFDTENSGYVMFIGTLSNYVVGQHSRSWVSCNNSYTWRDLTLHEYNMYIANKIGLIDE